MLKRWLIGLVAFALVGILILPQLAADMDFFFSHQFDKLIWNPFAGWKALLMSSKALGFYFLLLAGNGLLLLWILFTGSYLKYRSDMQVITPDIITPQAAGQGQFGTARWLKNGNIHRFFAVWKISRKDATFRELMEAGKKDREVIRSAELHID